MYRCEDCNPLELLRKYQQLDPAARQQFRRLLEDLIEKGGGNHAATGSPP